MLLGATHEHMRWDRDGFVRILDQNMLQGAKKKNFETTSTDAYSTFGTPFDYQSVMHHVVLKMARKIFSLERSPIFTATTPPKRLQSAPTDRQIGNIFTDY